MSQVKDFYTAAELQRRRLRKNRSDILAESSAAAGPAVKGPPCPTATAETFAPQAAKATKMFEFNGDIYARRFGHLDCNLVQMKGVKDPVAVCQFTGPRALKITTAKGTSYFLPGAGQPATITVIDEVPSCVMASNFR